MARKVGKRSIAQMKYHLYNKVINRNSFPAFSVMFDAGVESVLPTPLQNLQVPPGINTNYGILYALIISALLSALNNLAISIFNPNLNVQSFLELGQSPIFGQTVGIDFVNKSTQLYDYYLDLCKILYQPAVFDETYFDLSVYQPAEAIINRNKACKKLEKYFESLTSTNVSIDLSNLGVGNTQIPISDNFSLQNLQNIGLLDLLNALNLDFNNLPDLAKFIVSFIPNLNEIINSGFALDVGWLDRCVLAPEIE
jgi:hypothetical protein